MKKDDPLSSGGLLLLILGAMAFIPPLFDYEFLITSWLGSMQQPAGLSAMVVGGLLFGAGKLREFRNGSPVDSAPDVEPAVVTPNVLAGAGTTPDANSELHQPSDRQPA